MKRTVLCSLFIVITLSVLSNGSPLNDKYYIGEPPGCAALGRGHAFAGVKGHSFSPYWNPAGIISLARSGVGVSLNLLSETEIESEIIKDSYPLEGRKLNYISVCSNQVGVYWRPLSNRVDKTTGTDQGNNFIQTIDEKINVFGVTVAVPHSNKTDFGMNINIILGILGYSKEIDNDEDELIISDGIGWGLDWGLIYKVTDYVDFGISVINFPAQINWEDFEKDTLPTIFRAGMNLKMSQLMSLGLDYENGLYDEYVNSGRDTIHIGIEQYASKSVLLRCGVYSEDFYEKYENVFTAGVGYHKGGYKLDIAANQYYSGSTESEKIVRLSISGDIPF